MPASPAQPPGPDVDSLVVLLCRDPGGTEAGRGCPQSWGTHCAGRGAPPDPNCVLFTSTSMWPPAEESLVCGEGQRRPRWVQAEGMGSLPWSGRLPAPEAPVWFGEVAQPGLCVEGVPARAARPPSAMLLPQAGGPGGCRGPAGLRPRQEGSHHRPVCLGGASRLLTAASAGGGPGPGRAAAAFSALRCSAGAQGSPATAARPPLASQVAVGTLAQHWGGAFCEWPLVWPGRCPWPLCGSHWPRPLPAPVTGFSPVVAGCGVSLGAVTQPCPCCLLSVPFWGI